VLSHLLAASALILTISGAKPPDYSEKALCDLYAGAQCHATSCLPDAKERCTAVSVQCRDRTRERTVSTDRAERVAACARALLANACGAPIPAECNGVSGP
jgi:hypothetical protein